MKIFSINTNTFAKITYPEENRNGDWLYFSLFVKDFVTFSFKTKFNPKKCELHNAVEQ